MRANFLLVLLLVTLGGFTGCQSSGLGTTALAHAHQTLEGPSTPEQAAEWQGRDKPTPADADAATPDAEDDAESGAPDAEENAEVDAPPARPPLDPAKLFRENAAQLFRMSWQTRTRLQLRGAEILEVLHKVQIDENGDLKRRVLSSRRRSSAPISPEEPAANWEADAETLSDLIYAYTVTSMGSVARAVEGREALPKPGGLRTVSGTDAVIPGDRVRLEFSGSGELQALYVDTLLDGSPLEAEVFYRKLPHGPAYPARAQIKDASRDIQGTVESFSFRTF